MEYRITGFADEIHVDFEVQLSVLKELGQDYIELRSADGIGVADITMDKAYNLKQRMDQEGVKVSAIGSPIGKIMVTEDFSPHFDQFKHIVELTKVFETKYIRMFSFYMPEESEQAALQYKDEVFRRLEILITYAKEHDVVLMHENEKGIYGDIAIRCKDLMDRFYGDHFKCIFDFANFVQCNQDTIEAYGMLEPYISYVHVKDAKETNKEVVLPGDGDGHVEEILRCLSDKGYNGYLSIEPHLADFSGMDQLEQSERVRKEQDGIEAYKMAYHRLKGILNVMGG